MENTFRRDYPLTYTHIDCRGTARPGALCELMQDTATAHAEALGISAPEIGALWVLSRLRAHFDRPFHADEVLTLTTWCAGLKGATWLRGFQFYIGDEPVGEALSAWVVIDPVSRHLLRPSAVPASAHYPVFVPGTLVPPGKLRLPAGELHHTHTVRYSDLDVNRHLNNAKIVDLITDALDLQARPGLFVQSLQVNYTAESVAGDELALYVGEAEGVYSVRGVGADSERFEAAAVFAPCPPEA